MTAAVWSILDGRPKAADCFLLGRCRAAPQPTTGAGAFGVRLRGRQSQIIWYSILRSSIWGGSRYMSERNRRDNQAASVDARLCVLFAVGYQGPRATDQQR